MVEQSCLPQRETHSDVGEAQREEWERARTLLEKRPHIAQAGW